MMRDNFKLQGQFKIDVFDQQNNLKHTTDWFNNFITSTGLNYLFHLSPADCFRYVSIGSGNDANSIVDGGTTGLSMPSTISGTTYVGGADIGPTCTPFNNYVLAGCGWRMNDSGVRLNRAWRIPQTNDTFFDGPYTFKEYMVSPSLPPVTGFESDLVTPKTACGCDETVRDEAHQYVYGKENYLLYTYYKNAENSFNLCNQGIYAFARVLKDISVNTNEYIIINYALTINFNTGIRFFNLATSIDQTQPNQDEANWQIKGGSISGIYSLVHPGLKLVNGTSHNGTNAGKATNYVTDIGTNYTPPIGESFVPVLGNTFEPSCPKDLIQCYISNDNLQFLVNDISGGNMPTGKYFPYNTSGRAFPSGTLLFHKNWIDETSLYEPGFFGYNLQITTDYPHFISPRFGLSSFDEYPIYPDDTNYENGAKSSEILGGNFAPFALESVSPSVDKSSFTPSDRSRSVIRAFQFLEPNLDVDGEGESTFPVRAVVVAYDGGDITTNVPRYFPFLDLCFAPTSGKNNRLTTIVDTGNLTYEAPLKRINTPDSYNSGFSFMNDSNLLRLQFKVSWSSPCDPSVDGCP